ncbi:MAG: immunity 53 family protein [Niabella sp.]|nr:immunity 53 family protein [Niabella sp.]
MNILNWLITWYQSNCNGDWEHSFGIEIGTLDNPGWTIKIDLDGTNLEDKKYLQTEDKSDTDWYRVESDGNVFLGFGDPSKLEFLLNEFRKFSNESVND